MNIQDQNTGQESKGELALFQHYLDEFKRKQCFYEILIQFDLLKANTEHILEKGWLGLTGLFSDELNKMLLPELKKSSHVYTGILSAMAKGIQDATEIANQAGINTTSLGNYLPFLIDTLDLVYKEIPVTERPTSKNSRYVIKDPFILFWYRYMERNKALLEMGQYRKVVRQIVEDLPNLEGKVLEMIFREKILADLMTHFARTHYSIIPSFHYSIIPIVSEAN